MQTNIDAGDTIFLTLKDSESTVQDLMRSLVALQIAVRNAERKAESGVTDYMIRQDYEPDVDFEPIRETLAHISNDLEFIERRIERHLGAVEALYRFEHVDTEASE